MSIGTFDPNGGDVGYPERDFIGNVDDLRTRVIQATMALQRVKQVLTDVGLEKGKYLRYAIGINKNLSTNEINNALNLIGFAGTEEVKFYEIDGKRVFELRGPSGGVASMKVIYLVIKVEK